MSRPETRNTMKRVRGAAAAVAVALAAALGGTSAAAAQETEGLIPEGDWTDEQIEVLLALIEETETTLPATFPASGTYDDIASTLGDLGFHDFGAVAPGGYYHFINAGWLFDDHLIDPEHSESLVYRGDGDGNLELVSAMFMLRPDIGPDEIPEDIAWLPGWHGHPELCFGEGGGFAGITDPDDPDCPEGTTQGTTPLMMHVWIAEDNPCDHRFGGIGVRGVHCDHDDHADDHPDDHPDDGDDQDDHSDDDQSGDQTGDDDQTGDQTGDDDQTDDRADDQTGTAQPATPVVAQPTYTG